MITRSGQKNPATPRSILSRNLSGGMEKGHRKPSRRKGFSAKIRVLKLISKPKPLVA